MQNIPNGLNQRTRGRLYLQMAIAFSLKPNHIDGLPYGIESRRLDVANDVGDSCSQSYDCSWGDRGRQSSRQAGQQSRPPGLQGRSPHAVFKNLSSITAVLFSCPSEPWAMANVNYALPRVSEIGSCAPRSWSMIDQSMVLLS